MKNYLFLFGLAVIAVLTPVVIVTAFGTYTLPAIESQIATTVTVGPDTDVQIAASSSRSYLYVARDNDASAVYCLMDSDAPAVIGGAVSFKLATTTSNVYEIHQEKNPYSGAIRCTAAATTTVIVSEFRIR